MSPDTLKVINGTFAVAGQLDAADMAAVAQAGYKSVIINRPDFEAGPAQPVSSNVMQAARQAGLEVAYQPVVSGALTQADVDAFSRLMQTLPQPVLAYCRSGARCLQLYELANTTR
ncbi:MAG TPA: TIGR01244 family sulfur transferase [Burkholderiaceae bacterium]|nr:TIGR01244 family sulfur transferase [Burkholderiaceae bacterium]